MQVSESLAIGDVAAVKCTGPKGLNGVYLALFFVKTDAGWKNFSLQNSPPSISLETHLRNAATSLKASHPGAQVDVKLPSTQPAGNKEIADLEEQLRDLERQVDMEKVLHQRNETHPNVIDLRKRIALAQQWLVKARAGGQPATQAVAAESAATQPASGSARVDESNSKMVPQLRFLAWEANTPDAPPTAWRPNGELVQNEMDRQIIHQVAPARMGGRHADKWRVLNMWFSEPDADEKSFVRVRIQDAFGVALSSDGGSTLTSVRPREEGGIDSQDMGWLLVSQSLSREGNIPASADIVLDYSVGPWKESGRIDTDFKGGWTALDRGLTDGPGQDSEGKAFISISRDANAASQTQYDFVAVTLDGRELTYSRLGGFGSGPLRIERFTFESPLSDIQTFKFRTRPIWEVTFKNVSLVPGTITKPVMVVGPQPGTSQPATQMATNPAITQPSGQSSNGR